MDAERRVVYLEDLEPPKAKPVGAEKEPADASPSASQESNSTTKAKPAVTAVKRQRTLMEMFSPNAASAEPSSKKQKLVKSGSSSSVLAVAGKTAAGSSASATTLGLQPLNAIPFSMSAYQESLTEDQRRLLKLECESMGKSWLKLLKDEIRKPYFISLKEFLWKEGVQGPDDGAKNLKVYPAPKNIYSWSNYTPLGKVKVVIVGQDPYHGAGQAHGKFRLGSSGRRDMTTSCRPLLLCAAQHRGATVAAKCNKKLRFLLQGTSADARSQIYKEIKAEYSDFVPPKHGTLTAWAENGVLMLNTCLTVRAGDAGSHSQRGWEQFTDKVVDVVDRYGGANLPTANPSDKVGHGRGVVFLAWGAWAAKRVAKLDKPPCAPRVWESCSTDQAADVRVTQHPSPFSANKGFLGNGHFKKANDWLETRYGPDGQVNWCRLGPSYDGYRGITRLRQSDKGLLMGSYIGGRTWFCRAERAELEPVGDYQWSFSALYGRRIYYTCC
ncbi:hypothetical protein EVG20_g9399 [Dentipellis fragilis]|uniref:Uracil-DNA glycosylase-like domain-containing protein n=1 Tax=Dentipellis fragilis TaxID=205917 RepID=A0A4Y9XZJ2_9AGAM|nr:hypothetical protein EVG20_g9399 [Dentipellis fragilis]